MSLFLADDYAWQPGGAAGKDRHASARPLRPSQARSGASRPGSHPSQRAAQSLSHRPRHVVRGPWLWEEGRRGGPPREEAEGGRAGLVGGGFAAWRARLAAVGP
eukprot:9025286-Alexandrium_andersonii.AAC.1